MTICVYHTDKKPAACIKKQARRLVEFYEESVEYSKGKLADEKAKLSKKRKRNENLLVKNRYPDEFVFDEDKVR